MRKILLVDDDDLVREIGCRLLASMGHSVHPASSGSEAMAILESGQTFDFLFSDVMMPGGMNGIDLARSAAQSHPEMKIVLVTGNIDQDLLSQEPLSNRFTILSKPYRKQVLAQVFQD